MFYYNNQKLITVSEINRRTYQTFSLLSLYEEDLELVRNWRNNLRHSFIDQSIVSRDSQQKWFDSLDYRTSRYFISCLDDTKYGVFFLKNINFIEGTAEHGAFIGEPNFLNGPYSFASSYLINSVAFSSLNLKKLRISIIRNNRNAISYNLRLGYKEDYEKGELNYYTLTKEEWESRSQKIRKIVFGF